MGASNARASSASEHGPSAQEKRVSIGPAPRCRPKSYVMASHLCTKLHSTRLEQEPSNPPFDQGGAFVGQWKPHSKPTAVTHREP